MLAVESFLNAASNTIAKIIADHRLIGHYTSKKARIQSNFSLPNNILNYEVIQHYL
jgi:hypothetical protein